MAPARSTRTRSPSGDRATATVGYCLLSSSLEADPLITARTVRRQLHDVDRTSSRRSVARSSSTRGRRPWHVQRLASTPGQGGTDYTTWSPAARCPPLLTTTPAHGRAREGTPAVASPSDGPRRPEDSVDIHEITDVVVTERWTSLALLSDTFTGAATTAPVFGLPLGAGFPASPPAPTPAATPVPGCSGGLAGFTTTFAQSVPRRYRAAAGSASATLGNIEIDESRRACSRRPHPTFRSPSAG